MLAPFTREPECALTNLLRVECITPCCFISATAQQELASFKQAQLSMPGRQGKGSDLLQLGAPFHTDCAPPIELDQAPQVRALLAATHSLFGLRPTDLSRACVIFRRYRSGQHLRPHVDQTDVFGELVLSVVLLANRSSQLKLERGRKYESGAEGPSFSVPEDIGTALLLTGPARYSWLHGVPPLR